MFVEADVNPKRRTDRSSHGLALDARAHGVGEREP